MSIHIPPEVANQIAAGEVVECYKRVVVALNQMIRIMGRSMR